MIPPLPPDTSGSVIGPFEPRVYFTITREGDVILGPGVSLTEAAQAFWREVERIAPEGRSIRAEGTE